ncbi:MAG TPA: PPC domain-containing DNA-binding protein, partial [Pyrinomonadaceae bacterium]|nr:PPC domain-containing DNA-binding protein [Pyrinomonadaceae bacterium]
MIQTTFAKDARPRKVGQMGLLCAALMLSHLLADRAAAQAPKNANEPAKQSQESRSGHIAEGTANGMKLFALRLRPGQDLRLEIEKFAKAKGLKAGFIITTVGSLQQAALRLANQSDSSRFEGKFEIVSLVGTLSEEGVHLHISLSDNTGKTIGGHLVEGCVIYTTAEIVIGEARGIVFSRETDQTTGY